MKKNKHIVIGLGIFALLATGTVSIWMLQGSGKKTSASDLRDQALLALIKNDEAAFARFLQQGGDLHGVLPVIDGKTYTVAQGLSYFERPNFVKLVQERRLKFIKQNVGKEEDILSLAIPKNNPELLGLYFKESPKLDGRYGEKDWTLLHLASVHCSSKLMHILHKEAKLNWDLKAKDGATPLTLAAQHDCLPVLSYWKEQGADFKARDGKGQSALSILKKKKDAALLAFAESFEVRLPAAAPAQERPEPNFYKKRKIPKEKLVDHTALVEPEERPIEIVETAELSEFAD